MKQSKINNLNMLISDRPQFKKTSLLFDEIVQTLDCKLSYAKKYAGTHCNLLSFWSILKASELYDKGYPEFFRWMLENNHCTVEGYINKDKSEILKQLDITSCTLNEFNDCEDVLDPLQLDENKFYQMKIHGNTSGFHFMACYILEGVLYLTDSSYRGIGVKAEDFITQKNFIWLKEY